MEQSIDLRLILWTYDKPLKKRPGCFPIKLELYVDGRRPKTGTNQYVQPDQWDEDKQEVFNHPDAKFINTIIRKKKRHYQDKIEKMLALDEEIPLDLFEEGKSKKAFFTFCKEVRPDEVTQTMISRITDFWGREPTFKEMNMDFMRKFEAWHKDLIPDKKTGILKLRLHSNTLNNSARYLRRILGQAETEGYLRKNPFNKKYGGYKVPEVIESETEFLNEPERERLWQLFLDYKTKYDNQSKPMYDDKYKTLVYFTLATLTGFRHSDWSKFDPKERVQEDNMIRLRAHKNKKWVVMEMGAKLKTVIDEIRKIGLFTLDNKETNTWLRKLGPEAKIDKDFTSHAGRHTFGCLCASMGLQKQHTAYFMGISIKVVEVYYHLTGEAMKEQTKMLAAV